MSLWRIDPWHATVEFTAKHMMVASVRGRFGAVEGELDYDEDNPSAATVWARIAADSIDTTVQKRDKHLRSSDFLDVENYPELRFVSTAIVLKTPDRGTVVGDLTIRDVTRAVTLRTKKLGTIPGTADSAARIAFEASTRVNRKHWGLNWNQALETGGWLVGDTVSISLSVEASLVS